MTTQKKPPQQYRVLAALIGGLLAATRRLIPRAHAAPWAPPSDYIGEGHVNEGAMGDPVGYGAQAYGDLTGYGTHDRR